MDQHLYAIGDIHGRIDLAEKAISWIEDNSGCQPIHVVFLGDYIDRGSSSKQVLDFLMAGPRRSGDRYTCLRGNHEQLCLDSVRSLRHMRLWLLNGGDSTVESFGGPIDDTYLKWMSSLPYIYEDPLRIFVHAGLEPGVPLSAQRPESLMWIRETFLDARTGFEKHVVHGHTPIGPTLHPERTNLDSGAFNTGKLCVAGFLDPSEARPTVVKLIE